MWRAFEQKLPLCFCFSLTAFLVHVCLCDSFCDKAYVRALWYWILAHCGDCLGQHEQPVHLRYARTTSLGIILFYWFSITADAGQRSFCMSAWLPTVLRLFTHTGSHSLTNQPIHYTHLNSLVCGKKHAAFHQCKISQDSHNLNEPLNGSLASKTCWPDIGINYI